MKVNKLFKLIAVSALTLGMMTGCVEKIMKI